ncbi:MAG: motility protein A [Candidatus Cloacimonadota bacterium]|nr:MAG: motility protein A [Candidatus Cloacimonadota bacterium]
MDIATLLGIVLGIVLVFGPIVISGQIGAFIDVNSILIVVGGALSAVITSLPLNEALGVGAVMKNALFSSNKDPVAVIDTLVDLGEKARREGILALEREVKNLEDEFLKKAIQLAVDGNEVEIIESVMGTEVEYLEERHKKGIGVFEAMGSYAPAFGMLGTLVGLVGMLANLDDPSNIGGPMATALITTFYGSLVANVFCIPVAAKLKVRSAEEVLMKNMVLTGILSIQSGDNPRVLREKLETYIPPKIRKGSSKN